jgi:hypothetical protein
MKKLDNREDNIQTESLADLPLTTAQAEATKAGVDFMPYATSAAFSPFSGNGAFVSGARF